MEKKRCDDLGPLQLFFFEAGGNHKFLANVRFIECNRNEIQSLRIESTAGKLQYELTWTNSII